MNLAIIEFKRVVCLFIDSSSSESSTPQPRYKFVTALGLSAIDIGNMSRTSLSFSEGWRASAVCLIKHAQGLVVSCFAMDFC